GGTVSLVASLKDANGNTLSGRAITWRSSNTGVAAVSGAGLVTAAAAGSAAITATSEGQSGTASVSVTAVPVSVASVTVSPATASVQAGQTFQLTATPKDANGSALSGRTVTWTSSNGGVATVSGTGLVSGVAAGSATITAMSEGQSGSATIAVTAPVSPPGTVGDLTVVTTTDSSVTLRFTEVDGGTGAPASYDIRYVAGSAVSWGANTTSVNKGTCAMPVVGTAVGASRTCTVLGLASSTTYSFELVAYRGTLNVNAVFGALSNIATGTTPASTAAVASVTLSPSPASVRIGAILQLTATLKDAGGNVLSGRTVTWASDNAGIATVGSAGLVTGVVAG
ncbi:MAG TPA: Ig-like domain-containing protein, partial [Mycobacteriales bacterium]|nr:Ig-like domain-containing protein [Mycobacteriales bacterium]